MFTPTPSSTPASTVAGATSGSPTCTAAFQAARPASADAGATSASALAPWQRVDAAWPVISNAPGGLDGDTQKLVRRLLTQAAGQRLSRRRELTAARLWMWQPQPHLADYTRQRRFYAPGLYHFPPPDLYRMLCDEARLALEIVITPPGALGADVWQALLELQCQRIGQLHAALQPKLGAARAQAVLQGILEGLAC